jgi:hypothetical protein
MGSAPAEVESPGANGCDATRAQRLRASCTLTRTPFLSTYDQAIFGFSVAKLRELIRRNRSTSPQTRIHRVGVRRNQPARGPKTSIARIRVLHHFWGEGKWISCAWNSFSLLPPWSVAVAPGQTIEIFRADVAPLSRPRCCGLHPRTDCRPRPKDLNQSADRNANRSAGAEHVSRMSS